MALLSQIKGEMWQNVCLINTFEKNGKTMDLRWVSSVSADFETMRSSGNIAKKLDKYNDWWNLSAK